MAARFLILLPLLAAVASAAQLAVQNARVTVSSNDGSQLRAETYVFLHVCAVSNSRFAVISLAWWGIVLAYKSGKTIHQRL